MGILLLVGLLAAGCGDEAAAPEAPAEQAESTRVLETDFYLMQVPVAWEVQVVDYGDGLPSGDVVFLDEAGERLGGATVLMAANDSLSDLPQQIRVTSEKTDGELILGKIEVVGDALGGDTASEYHALVPLDEDREVHDYVDVYLKGASFTLAQVADLAESVVIRNQQFLGYIEALDDEAVAVYPVELVEESDGERKSRLGLAEEDFQNGLAIVRTVEEAKRFPLAAEVSYYLVQQEEQMFTEVALGDFKRFLQAHPDGLYDVTIQDGQVVTIEERLL